MATPKTTNLAYPDPGTVISAQSVSASTVEVDTVDSGSNGKAAYFHLIVF